VRQVRQRRILEILGAERQAKVGDLADRLGVAEMTIRRDLDHLHGRGMVERTHGGAVIAEGRSALLEPPMLQRIDDQAETKARIAGAVAASVNEGETLFLGSGTTTLAVARALAGRRKLTVITNALTVINALASSPEITVIVIGGFLRRDELSFIGHLAEDAIRGLRVGKVILGIRGIDPQYGLTSDHLQELKTDQAILSISDTIIIVADATKFGRVATSQTAPVTAASWIVTGSDAPAETVDALRALGVRVTLV
jgi:DeoR/GlpR family transcriptional regulator of sugar metabolism